MRTLGIYEGAIAFINIIEVEKGFRRWGVKIRVQNRLNIILWSRIISLTIYTDEYVGPGCYSTSYDDLNKYALGSFQSPAPGAGPGSDESLFTSCCLPNLNENFSIM